MIYVSKIQKRKNELKFAEKTSEEIPAGPCKISAQLRNIALPNLRIPP
jgi:hypothetical protein